VANNKRFITNKLNQQYSFYRNCCNLTPKLEASFSIDKLKNMDNKKMVFGFLAGVAAGVGLYAFLKSDQGKAVLDDAKATAEEWQKEFETLLAKGKTMAEDLGQKVREAKMDA